MVESRRIVLLRPGSRRFVVADGEAKLRFRASLPGAFGYDQAAHVLRALQADGVPADVLLPLAMPTSWMVNARASSRAFQRWLTLPALDVFQELLRALPENASPSSWLETGDSERDHVTELVTALVGNEGATLTALTKVLALLRPQLVPLMDDAAIWFALDAVPRPTTADAPSGKPSLFVPMLDWFSRSVTDNEDALVSLAAKHDRAVLDAPQTLDRLLWIESWGHRHSHDGNDAKRSRWWWVRDGMRESIVPLEGPHPSRGPGEPIDLQDATLDGAWIARAREALEASFVAS